MSLKRRLSEYHDPDYPQNSTENDCKLRRLDSEQRLEKIQTIIKREFQKELQQKEQEVQQIDEKLRQAKCLFQRVRYSIVASYYSRKNLEYSENEMKQKDVNHLPVDEPNCLLNSNKKMIQNAVHPSLKRLLGQKPVDYNEILSIRPARQAAQTARASMSEKLIKPKKDDKKGRIEETKVLGNLAKHPISESAKPEIQRLRSARGVNQFRHLIVVGNTSQYIGDDKSVNDVTHKWLIYIKTKDSEVAIEKIVSKIRFFLHPSYKPNDVIEVSSPPFQLSRRGWGEFPVRVQLYFHSHINQKPLQIIHNLILDKRLTGLQTMGAETVVELWLNEPNNTTEEESIPNQNVSNYENTSPTTTVVAASQDDQLTAEKLETNAISITETNSKIEYDKQFQKILQNIKSEPPLDINEHENFEEPEEVSQNFKISNSFENPKQPSAIAQNPTIARATANSIVIQKPSPVIQSSPAKKVFKCLDKNGKIITVGLMVDPAKMKNIKIIKLPAAAANKLITTSAQNVENQKSQGLQSNLVFQTLPKTVVSSSLTTAATSKLMKIVPNSTLTTSTVVPANTPTIQKIMILPKKSEPGTMPTNTGAVYRVAKLIPNSVNSLATGKPSISIAGTSKGNIQSKSIVQPNVSKVIMKNGQIFLANSLMDKSISKPKQESLLKPKPPQMSLLKPNFNSIAKAAMNPLTTDPTILRENNFKTNQSKLPPDYVGLLRRKFLNINKFTGMRSAIEFLLKYTPLINSLAGNEQYQKQFLFVVENMMKFHSLSMVKRQSNEWYRARFINRLIRQHEHFKSCKQWTTKEIVQFGRQFGYTPQSNGEPKIPVSLDTNPNRLADLIKKEIKSEQLKSDTLTSNGRIQNWIEQHCSKGHDKQIALNEDVEDIDIVNVFNDHQYQNNEKIVHKTNLNENSKSANVSCLQIDSHLHMESRWVIDLCRDIKIQLNAEEIVPGVMHMSAQLVLVQALRKFLEQLLRQAYSTKLDTDNSSSLDNGIRSEHICQVIKTITEFDFLSNKHLGMPACNDDDDDDDGKNGHK